MLCRGRAQLTVKTLKVLFVLVDLGFVVYWVCAGLHLFPQDYLFKDYDNPILQAWNFSFLPLDLLVSATGLSSVACHARGLWQWQPLALVSLTLTSCSGLQAIAFWALRGDFDPVWWAPNLFLLIYPLCFFPVVLRTR
jgi:hypothetical protein